MQQRSLFPDGFELQEQALAALRELRVSAALEHVRRARLAGRPLVGIDALEQALQWLAPRTTSEPDAAAAATALHELGSADLHATAAGLVETALAGFLARRLPREGFADPSRLVSMARVSLLLGDSGAARESAATLLGSGHGEHAALWFDHADACWALQRQDEANASYVRATLLGPHDGHARRCRHDALRELWQQLAVAGAEGALLAEAWCAGVLTIARGNIWATAAQRERARERSAADAGWSFSWLLYVDRSAPPGQVDVALRERMADLLPDAFARFLAAVREREG